MQDRMGFYRLEEEGRALPLVLRRRKRRLAVCISRKGNFTGVKKGGGDSPRQYAHFKDLDFLKHSIIYPATAD